MRFIVVMLLVTLGCSLTLGSPNSGKVLKRQIDILSSNTDPVGQLIPPRILDTVKPSLDAPIDGMLKIAEKLPLPIKETGILGGLTDMVGGDLLPL